MRLFRPFWRSIAITVVKELLTRPQIAQQLSDLLGTTVSELLVWTTTNTLPYLILMRKHEVLRRIAQAHGSEASVWSICVQPVNMAAILAFLLIQPSTDPERMITTLLTETSTDFKDRDLVDLVRMEPILTAFELLKAAGEDDEARKPKAGVAVRIIASEMLMLAKGTPSNHSPCNKCLSKRWIFKRIHTQKFRRPLLRDLRAWHYGPDHQYHQRCTSYTARGREEEVSWGHQRDG